MRHKKELFFLYTLIGLQLVGQIPFANAIQTSLLLNPAFAGNKNKHRIQSAWNSNEDENYKNSAYYLSYDNFSRNLKLGYGVYWLHTYQQAPMVNNDHHRNDGKPSHEVNGAQYDYFRHDILKEKFPNKWSGNKVGICVASKHNLNRVGKVNETVGTFSPSVAIELKESHAQYIAGGVYTKRQHPDTFFLDQDTIMYTGIAWKDSLSYMHQIAFDRGFVAQIGLKYTGKNFMVMYSLGLGTDYTREIDYVWATKAKEDYIGPLTERTQSIRHYRHRLVTHKFAVGYSFPKDPEAPSGIALLASVGTTKYKIGSAQMSSGSEHCAYKDVYTPLVSQLYFGGVLRYKMILFNGSYTQYGLYRTYGVGMGLQGESYRCMATFFPVLKNHPSTLEFTLGVFI